MHFYIELWKAKGAWDKLPLEKLVAPKERYQRCVNSSSQ